MPRTPALAADISRSGLHAGHLSSLNGSLFTRFHHTHENRKVDLSGTRPLTRHRQGVESWICTPGLSSNANRASDELAVVAVLAYVAE